MNAKQLAIISGLALTLSAGTALAQNRGSGTQQDSRDRGVQQDRQDRLEAASRAARDSRYGSSTNILNSLEGMWKVQVQVNRTNWDLMSSGGREPTRDRGDGRDTGLGRDGAEPDANNPRTDRENEREVRERELRDREERTTQQREERGQREGLGQDDDRQTRTATRGQDQRMDSADGMARSHPILGGDILRTTMIFGEDAGASQRSTDARNREGRGEGQGQNQGQSQMNSDDLQSVSYLGFDEEAGEYNLALMTGQSGAIHYLTGKYDQSSRRIIFTSQQQGASAASRQDHPGSAGRQGESSTTRTSARGASTDGMSVVLQMESGDSYTITAYRGSASMQSPSGSGMDIGGQPGQRSERGNERGQDRQEGDQRQDRAGSLASAAPNVIYKATYTKADQSTRTQAESIFEAHDRKERLASRNR